jgi:glycosyltransferase involved in cell wall biosynthesis
MNVLLIGHACGPGMGSEPGLTWNWAQYLSRQHRVWVIAHPKFRTKVDAWMRENSNPNVRFIWVDVKSVLDPWNPAKGERGIRVHYLMWLKKAYAAANALSCEVSFDIAHHVSWSTLRAAPPLWELHVPSVWGPVGGGHYAPFAFLPYFGWRAVPELARSISSMALRLSPRLRKAAGSAALVFATNRETETLLKRVGARVHLLLDCGVPTDWILTAPPKERRHGEFTLLWAGRLEPLKAAALALQALAEVQSVPVRLVIAGSGALKTKLEALAKKLNLSERVTFLGAVSYEEMRTLFQRSDAFLFTSLRDSFGSVVLEAMSQGLPVVTLNHQGVGTHIPDQAGIKVPVTTPRKTIQSLAGAIEKIANSRDLHRSMQLASWNFARDQTWDRRARQMSTIYEEVASRQTVSIGGISSSTTTL